MVRLTSDEAVDAAYLRCLAAKPIETAVACNPDDLAKNMGGMSALAPWLAVSSAPRCC